MPGHIPIAPDGHLMAGSFIAPHCTRRPARALVMSSLCFAKGVQTPRFATASSAKHPLKLRVYATTQRQAVFFGSMKNQNPNANVYSVDCPFCGGKLEPVKIIPDVKLGLPTSLFGYSIGTKARLSWFRPGENYAPTRIPERSAYEGCSIQKFQNVPSVSSR